MNNSFNSAEFLRTVTRQAGVYCMMDSANKTLYVGKAKNLYKRLASYFNLTARSQKINSMIQQVRHIDITVTHTESEALLLEHNYIKRYQPRYNVLLRDDKSYPYLFLSSDKHPRLALHRGAKKAPGNYFGPYPHIASTHTILSLLQKIFPIRQCTNSIYSNRTHPCLQYQIGRCSAPCVGLISDQEYQKQVDAVKLFLAGKNEQVVEKLIIDMQSASDQLAFESAAKIRDQIQAVRKITQQQCIAGGHEHKTLDIIGIALRAEVACVNVLFIRQGKILGSRSYFPHIPANTALAEIVETFLGQFYLSGNTERTLPNEIILHTPFAGKQILEALITQQHQRPILIKILPQGAYTTAIKLAETNAIAALSSHLIKRTSIEKRMHELSIALNLSTINCIECFDVSHTMGQQTVAACVVFTTQGISRSDCRRYHITGVTPGDDYAAMKQLLMRRFSMAITEVEYHFPDIILVDGGKGQLAQAVEYFQQVMKQRTDISSLPLLVSVAKGEGRKPGLEKIYCVALNRSSILNKTISYRKIPLSATSAALHLIQQIRDEAHQYAITFHHKQRIKQAKVTILEQISGIGPQKRRKLLTYMGGLQSLKNASIDEIAKVPQISYVLATKIYYALKE